MLGKSIDQYHIISYIISYHIISYHIISYHIIYILVIIYIRDYVCVREYLGKVKLLSFQLLTHPGIIFGWSQISNSIPILRGKIVRFLLDKSIMTHIKKKNKT